MKRTSVPFPQFIDTLYYCVGRQYAGRVCVRGTNLALYVSPLNYLQL